ncbi:MAG: SCP2 sterol-binding domain-containing protein, partial [Pseudomonadota bacterium]
MLLKTLFFGALEDALNRYIAMDPDAGLFLRPLCGKVIAVQPKGLGWDFYLCPCEDGMQLLQEFEGKPDTTLIGSPLALGMMGLSDAPSRTLFSGEVKMEGDVDTGRKLQAFFEKLDIDLEEQLARLTGDIVAHKVGNLVRGGHAWGRASLETFKMKLSEYMQEEARDLPTRVETEMFFSDVDKIRSAGDRLEA